MKKPEIFLEHILNENPGTQWIFVFIIFIYILSVLSTVMLYYVFYLIGHTFNNPAIKQNKNRMIILFVFVKFLEALIAIPSDVCE